jgi:WD40 repeat protein
MAEAYTDLLLRIFPYDERAQSYPVEAELDDGSRFTGGQLKLDRQTLLTQQLDAEAYGKTLFDALFAGDIRRAYDKATGAAEAKTGGRLRLRLWVDNEAVELHAVPWERIYHLHKGRAVPLGASALTPLSRYTSLEVREPPPVADTPIRMLVAISNPLNLPGGLAPANVDVEIDNLRRSLSELKKQGKIDVTLLPGRTGLSSTIRAKLEAEGYVIVEGVTNLFNIAPHLAKCHVFHFIGHGAFRRRSEHGEGMAALYLEKGDGAWQAVKDEEIVSMLTALGTLPHLVFLVACESAKRDDNAESPFVGLGPKLVQAGVPAVVAMQEQVPVEMARLLSGEFYARLAEHGEVDRALNQARLQVFDSKRTEWAIPVLFMRIRKGRLFGADLEEDAPAPGEPPFKGLEYFGENDADKFYGRELLTAKLVGKLRLGRFLPIIVGASGSGKSSVVRAGLLPALKRGTQLADGTLPPEGSRSWVTYTFTPGAKPLDALAAALTRDEESATATTTLIDDLAIDKRALHLRALKLLSRRPDARRVLVVVDQFEEIFTVTKDESERRAFIDALMYASSEAADGPTVVVIVFRADFYAHCAQYANLREAVATMQEFVGPMNKEELRRAIEEPAKAGGWDMEPGLVDLILKEVGDEPGALPLMQHALLETWKRRRGRTMTLRGYNDAGGIRGAIAKTAEAIYQALPAEQQRFARRIFLKLVELGEGTQDTRRRAQLEELYPRPEERPLAESVLKKLVDNRLIVTTEKTAEVAHEALIREWPTYRDWINANRAGLKTHRDLTRAAREWENMARAPEMLYRGVKLLETIEWAEENPDETNELEADFLAASREDVEREAREKEAQRQRELEQAKRIAEEQSRAAEAAQKAANLEKQRAEEQERANKRQRLLTRIAAGVGVVAFFAAIVAGVFWFQANESFKRAEEARQAADEQRILALSGQLASQARSLPGTQLDLTLLLGAEAYGLNPSLERLGGLLTSLDRTSPLAFSLRGHEGQVGALAFSPDNAWLASADKQGKIFLWDLTQETAHPAGLPLEGHQGYVYALVFHPDGRRLISASDDGQIILWELVEEWQVETTAQAHGGVVALALDPDRQRLAVGTTNGIELRDANSLELIAGPTADYQDLVMSLAFSPNGERLVAGSWEGRIVMFEADTLLPLPDRDAIQLGTVVSALAFDPSGKTFISGDWDFFVQVWDANTLAQVGATPVSVFGRVLNVTFTDADRLWFVNSDNAFNFWDRDPAKGGVNQPLADYKGSIDAAAVSRDGTLGASNDGSHVLVWRLESTAPEGHNLSSGDAPFVPSVAVSRDSATLATGGSDGYIQLWDAEGFQPRPEPWSAHEGWVTRLAFSRDDQWLASAGGDGKVNVWEVSSGALLKTLEGYTAAFSPDGAWLASSASSNGTVRLWSLPGYEMTEIYLGEVFIHGLAFTPDSSRLVVANQGNFVYSIKVPSGEQGDPLSGHTDQVLSVAVSPDGALIASGSAALDTTIRLWDAATGESRGILAGHTTAVRAVAFSPDSKLLLSTGDDGTVRLWDVEGRKPIATLQSHAQGYGYGVAFSPNSQWLVSVGNDLRSYINVRDLDPLALLSRACDLAGRNLTQAEWSLYLPEGLPYHKTCEQWPEGN